MLVLVLMPLIGLALNNAFSVQAKSAVKNELSAYVYSVLAVAEVENQQLYMPEQLLENQFNVNQSGLYVLISTGKHSEQENETNIIWNSDSFLGFKHPKKLPAPDIGNSTFNELNLDDHQYLIYSFTASFAQQGAPKFPITVHIIKDHTLLQQQINKFSTQLWSWLFILMALLLVAQVAWLLWTLRPLARFAKELKQVEQGNIPQINENYPSELQAVASQLNTLINTEQNQRKRYRNALSDLAHSLKTPLAVMQSQQDISTSSMEQLSIINNIIGHQLKRAQTGASASWHLGIKVTSVSDKLVRVLSKLYAEQAIHITQHVDQHALFKGDAADLSEILGNLLDNACKAARSQVLLSVVSEKDGLYINVEDDGQGVSEEQQSRIFERGVRADSYQQGHGVGLAIVADLIDSYHGKLSVSSSEKLKGAKFTCKFQTVKK